MLSSFNRYVLERVIDGILGDDSVAAMVGDAVVEELRGLGV